ncbi:MAG: urease accessory protein UreE [Pseudomonadota bacterium]
MTGSDLTATDIRPAGTWTKAQDLVTLDYDGRFLRRRRLTTASGQSVMVDLPRTTSLEPGDALSLSDGTLLEVVAAEEDLTEVRAGEGASSLVRLAWHIGNRHTPCQIEDDRCLIRRDPVLENMLRGLGASVAPVSEPFLPEGGAYGQGRTLGHSHDTGAQSHGHDAAHDHGHDHPHDHPHRAVHHHGSHGGQDADDAPASEP